MKVICSFSLLLRVAFWLVAVSLVIGFALAHPSAGGAAVPSVPARSTM